MDTSGVLYRSENAATLAKKAAENARDEIFRSSTMIELAAATSSLNEIKRLQRSGGWQDLPDKYSALRSSLIAIRAGSKALEEHHKVAIQDAIAQIRTIEGKIERAIEAKEPPSAAKLNTIISIQLDKLSLVLGELRSNKNG